MRTLYAILIAVLIAGGAQAETKRVGQWIVKAERDPFSDQINVFVMTFNNSGGLAFRCLHGDPSIALNQARAKYQEGDEFEIALRVDRQPIVETSGMAIGDSFIEVTEHVPEIMKEISSGRELAVRITGVTRSTMVFSLANIPTAIAPLLKACPLEAAPAKPFLPSKYVPE